jgi:DNA polymerase-3 subunit delta'
VGRLERIKVDDIDSVLQFISVAPFLSDRKVVVLDNAESMTWEASNRLLKMLEEPPLTVNFLLVSSDPDRIIPTVRSRCIPFQFGKLSKEDCTNIICKKMGFDLPKAVVLGWIACGTSSDVFSKAGVYLKNRDLAIGFISTLRAKDPLDALDFVERVERHEMPIFLDMVMLVMTDLITLKESTNDIVNADSRKELEKISDGLSGQALVLAANFISQAKRGEAFNVNMSMALKNAILKSQPLMVKS